MDLSVVWKYLTVFAVGGALCVPAQLLIDKTKLTPARILVGYVVTGVILGAVGLYQPLADFAGAGANTPLTGFGNVIAKGVRRAVDEKVTRCSDRRAVRGCRGNCRRAYLRLPRGAVLPGKAEGLTAGFQETYVPSGGSPNASRSFSTAAFSIRLT